jgi:hypothetical protein
LRASHVQQGPRRCEHALFLTHQTHDCHAAPWAAVMWQSVLKMMPPNSEDGDAYSS